MTIKYKYQYGVKTIITINEMLIMISPLIGRTTNFSIKLLNVEIDNIIPPMMKMAEPKNGIDIYIDCVLEKSVTRCVKLTTIVNMIAINFWSVMYTGFNFLSM